MLGTQWMQALPLSIAGLMMSVTTAAATEEQPEAAANYDFGAACESMRQEINPILQAPDMTNSDKRFAIFKVRMRMYEKYESDLGAQRSELMPYWVKKRDDFIKDQALAMIDDRSLSAWEVVKANPITLPLFFLGTLFFVVMYAKATAEGLHKFAKVTMLGALFTTAIPILFHEVLTDNVEHAYPPMLADACQRAEESAKLNSVPNPWE